MLYVALLFPQLISHPKYVSCKRIAVFLSMHDEVQTEEIIQDVFKRGKRCFIPRYESNSNHMDMLELRSVQDIETLPLTSWNIRQPSQDDDSREEALASGEQHAHVHAHTHTIEYNLFFCPIGTFIWTNKFFTVCLESVWATTWTVKSKILILAVKAVTTFQNWTLLPLQP